MSLMPFDDDTAAAGPGRRPHATPPAGEPLVIDEAVDVHCHCLPSVDDGPADLVESIAVRQLVADGITTAIATPHQLGRYQGRNEAAAVGRPSRR